MDADAVRQALADLRTGDLPTHGGRTLAYVYDSGLAEADAVGREAMSAFAATNALDPTAFPSLLAMENDVVALTGALAGAPDGFAGTVTSGGTESILLAVQAARDARPEVGEPELVLPTTAHAAFHKAAHYFRVRPVFVDVDPTTFRADATAVAEAITERTVLVVASAPSYAHGVVDPVPAIADAAGDRGVRCHVDACIGGWVLPFLDDAPPWSFPASEGVTSVSVDLHKYAYTPKGVSVLLHRTAALRRPQFFASAAWPGYTMLNSTTQSTKSGGPLAAAWAVTRVIGRDRYAELARRAHAAALELAAAVEESDHLSVVARPDTTLLAVRADAECDVFSVCDELLDRGWYAQPQLSFQGQPATLHLSLSAATAALLDEVVAALRESVAAAVDAGPVAVPPELAVVAAAIDPATLDDAAFTGLLQVAGLAGPDPEQVALPRRMAGVNALLDVAPPALREALLVAFLDRLSRPSTLDPHP